MSRNTMKPCPFCGKTADLWYSRSRYGYFGYIRCDFCEAQTRIKGLRGKPDDDGFFEQVAVTELYNLWNCRPEKGED